MVRTPAWDAMNPFRAKSYLKILVSFPFFKMNSQSSFLATEQTVGRKITIKSSEKTEIMKILLRLSAERGIS